MMVDRDLAGRGRTVTARRLSGHGRIECQKQQICNACGLFDRWNGMICRAAGERTDVGKKKDAAELARREREEWQLGQDWARWLIGGNAPQPLTLYGIVLERGRDRLPADTSCTMRGCTAGAGGTTRRRPLLRQAGHGARDDGCERRGEREPQGSRAGATCNCCGAICRKCRLIATNYRLMCHLPARGWLSFYYTAVQEFYPDPANWTITFGFQNAEPLRLGGLPVPTLSVLTAWCVLGRPLAERARASRRWSRPPTAPQLPPASRAQVEGQRRPPRIPGQD